MSTIIEGEVMSLENSETNKITKTWRVCDLVKQKNEFKYDPIVEGFFSRKELVLITATAKTGKTFLNLYLASCVSRGISFLDTFNTKKSRVLYFETELHEGRLIERLEKLVPDVEKEDDYFYVSKERFQLDREEERQLFQWLIINLDARIIVLDPLYCLHSKSEDKQQEMSQILNFLKQTAQLLDICIILIHHEGKKGESLGNQTSHRPRGSSAFADIPDVIISMTRINDKERRLSIENRNYPSTTLRIEYDNDAGKWNLLGSNEQKKSDLLTKEFLLDLIEEKLTVSKKQLFKLVKQSFDISEKTFERKINELIESGGIKRVSKGNAAYYELTSTTSDIS